MTRFTLTGNPRVDVAILLIASAGVLLAILKSLGVFKDGRGKVCSHTSPAHSPSPVRKAAKDAGP